MVEEGTEGDIGRVVDPNRETSVETVKERATELADAEKPWNLVVYRRIVQPREDRFAS